MTTQQISCENKASKVSNLRCGWSCQAISVTSVTLYDPRLERIRCMKSRQSFSRLTRPQGVSGSHVHTRGPRLRRFAPSENVQKRLFCSLAKRFLCEYLQIYMLQSIKNIRSYAQYCIDLMFGVFTFTLSQFLAKTIFFQRVWGCTK